MKWSSFTNLSNRYVHLEVLLDPHDLLEDAPASGVLLAQALLQAVHPSPWVTRLQHGQGSGYGKEIHGYGSSEVGGVNNLELGRMNLQQS